MTAGRRSYALYAVAFAVSLSIWFLAIRAPLWLDETGSYWEIYRGFWPIWARQGLTYVTYPDILWFFTRVLGTSETALRIPSVLAMLGALWALYRSAREFLEPDLAWIAVIIFSINPVVAFAAVDIRPYAFAALVINLSIWTALRLRRSESLRLAALFGLCSAFILYFQYLFAVILPALLVCFFAFPGKPRRIRWQQFAIAVAVFVVACLPLIPAVVNLFTTSGSHIFDVAPQFADLLWTLAPGWLPIALCVTATAAVTAALRARTKQEVRFDHRTALTCAALALVPVLTLYLISVATPLHIFTARHRLVALPGITLCWTLLLSPFRSRRLRLLFCAVLVVPTAVQTFRSPDATQHGYTWKYALQVAEKNASTDDAPVVICSDFPESDFVPMPMRSAKTSRYFAQLSYYRLTVPVIPLPRSLNTEAEQAGSEFLQEAESRHERFLALAFRPSYITLDWLSRKAADHYTVRPLGIFDSIKVLEFDPRPASSQH